MKNATVIKARIEKNSNEMREINSRLADYEEKLKNPKISPREYRDLANARVYSFVRFDELQRKNAELYRKLAVAGC